MTLLHQPASPLLPIDYVFYDKGSYPNEFVLFFDTRINISRFKAALDDTIPSFHLISSRLESAGDQSFKLRYHPDGLDFKSEIIFGEMTVRSPWTYLKSVRTELMQPLSRIRLTQFGDGSALSFSISHLVADGFSCFNFFTQLARAYRGLPVIPPDFLRNWYLTSRAGHDVTCLNEGLFKSTGFTVAYPRHDIPHENISRQQMHFPKKLIDELLKEAKLTSTVEVTTNDVIAAKLWQTFIPRWHKPQSRAVYEPKIIIPYNVRRIPEWLNDRFFGNGVCLAGTTYQGEQFSTAPLGELASLIRSTVKNVSRAYVQDAYDFIEAYRNEFGLEAMQSLHTVDPQDGILVTNLSRVPFHEVDFGDGPAFRITPVTRAPRTVLLLPKGDGILADITFPCTMLNN